jgi:hypothetical protein
MQQHAVTENGARPAGILHDGGFIDPSQLAVELGISERTLARWGVLREGPPKLKVGKKVLYRRASVIGWLEEREGRQPRKGRR